MAGNGGARIPAPAICLKTPALFHLRNAHLEIRVSCSGVGLFDVVVRKATCALNASRVEIRCACSTCVASS